MGTSHPLPTGERVRTPLPRGRGRGRGKSARESLPALRLVYLSIGLLRRYGKGTWGALRGDPASREAWEREVWLERWLCGEGETRRGGEGVTVSLSPPLLVSLSQKRGREGDLSPILTDS
jgi:hypothetical protein